MGLLSNVWPARWGWLTCSNVSTASIFITWEDFQVFKHCHRGKTMGFGVWSIGLRCQVCPLMAVVVRLLFRNIHSFPPHLFHGRVVFPCPVDFGLGPVTCFGQWNSGRQDAVKTWHGHAQLEFVLAPLPWLVPWSEEEGGPGSLAV